jgi:nucleoside 2-deoxyribosyltransferase
MKKVYVAGKMTAVKEVRKVQQMVSDRGGTITFDWTGPEGKIRRDWHGHPDQANRIAETERMAVEEADFVILCHHDHGLGMYIETGMALAQHKEVLMYGRKNDSVFWYLPEVLYTETEEQLADHLDSMIGLPIG